MNKLEMAHEWAMKHGKSDTIGDRSNTIRYAWEYADAMQKEWDEREKAEAKEKCKEFRLEKAQIIATTVQCHKRKRP